RRWRTTRWSERRATPAAEQWSPSDTGAEQWSPSDTGAEQWSPSDTGAEQWSRSDTSVPQKCPLATTVRLLDGCVSLYCAVRVSCSPIQLDAVPTFHSESTS